MFSVTALQITPDKMNSDAEQRRIISVSFLANGALSRDRMRDILHVKINDTWGEVDGDNLTI